MRNRQQAVSDIHQPPVLFEDSPMCTRLRPTVADDLAEELALTVRHRRAFEHFLEDLRDYDSGTRMYTCLLIVIGARALRRLGATYEASRPDFDLLFDAKQPATPFGWRMVRAVNLAARLIIRGCRRKMAEAVYRELLSATEPHFELRVPSTSRGRRRLNKPTS